MATQANDKRRHLLLANTSESKPFTTPPRSRGEKPPLPELQRAEHGAHLRTQLSELSAIAEETHKSQKLIALESGLGIQIQFVGQPEVELAIQSLSNDPKGIELLSVVREGNQLIANVFVPDGKLAHFEGYITDYLAEKKNKKQIPIDHRNLLETIQNIRMAEVKALWTDDPDLLPEDVNESFIWEVWLPVRGKHGELREAIVNDFTSLAITNGGTVSSARVDFPERVIVLMEASQKQIAFSVNTLNCIAELRKAKVTAEFFDSMGVEEQDGWVQHLLARTQLPQNPATTPKVCLIDSGVNRSHPLLENSLLPNDMHSVNPAWGVSDKENHGTGLAGIALYGDLTDALESNTPVNLTHGLESVKILDTQGGNVGTTDFHAYLFAEAVARPEILEPERLRVFNSSITSDDYRDRGRPSSWSATLDSLASDADNNGQFPRLFVQSAGNMLDQNAWTHYPAHLSTNLIHDPGQSWNAITVGAYTNKSNISEDDAKAYQPLASAGGLSPMTTTSRDWHGAWPLKPDVVFEGGNAALDGISAVTMPSLSLLTTHNDHLARLFTTSNATSAASAQCSAMAAQLMHAYPNLRPETVRALIVHSAVWTQTMLDMYLPKAASVKKTDYINLIRHCGWGLPDLDGALWSASNSLTLIVEDVVRPYKKEDSATKSNEMNLHSIPWPVEELEALGELPVEMRVTLSYFIEPNPSTRGVGSKFYYPSHRLRFDCRRPTENLEEFIHRVNAYTGKDDENDTPPNKLTGSSDDQWLIGEQQRHKGSIHQDIWTGTAADLAQRGHIAVYPALGWWRSRQKLEKYNSDAHYSLIVSIRTPETETDLYLSIQNRIELMQVVEIH